MPKLVGGEEVNHTDQDRMLEAAAQVAGCMACEAVGRVADQYLRLLIPAATEPTRLSPEQSRELSEESADAAVALGDRMVAIFSVLLPKVLQEMQRAGSRCSIP